MSFNLYNRFVEQRFVFLILQCARKYVCMRKLGTSNLAFRKKDRKFIIALKQVFLYFLEFFLFWFPTMTVVIAWASY